VTPESVRLSGNGKSAGLLRSDVSLPLVPTSSTVTHPYAIHPSRRPPSRPVIPSTSHHDQMPIFSIPSCPLIRRLPAHHHRPYLARSNPWSFINPRNLGTYSPAPSRQEAALRSTNPARSITVSPSADVRLDVPASLSYTHTHTHTHTRLFRPQSGSRRFKDLRKGHKWWKLRGRSRGRVVVRVAHVRRFHVRGWLNSCMR